MPCLGTCYVKFRVILLGPVPPKAPSHRTGGESAKRDAEELHRVLQGSHLTSKGIYHWPRNCWRYHAAHADDSTPHRSHLGVLCFTLRKPPPTRDSEFYGFSGVQSLLFPNNRRQYGFFQNLWEKKATAPLFPFLSITKTTGKKLSYSWAAYSPSKENVGGHSDVSAEAGPLRSWSSGWKTRAKTPEHDFALQEQGIQLGGRKFWASPLVPGLFLVSTHMLPNVKCSP